MVDVGVGKVPLGPAKSPSRRDGGTRLTGRLKLKMQNFPR